MIYDKVLGGDAKATSFNFDGILGISGLFCFLRVGRLIRLILEEAYSSTYSIHPKAAKMYHNQNQHFWCGGMKINIMVFMTKYFNSQ